jgi:hypothetical protein
MKRLLLCSLILSLFLLPASLRADDSVGATPASTYTGRENIEWSDIWLPHTTENGLPRVLLIGDSITRGYYPVVDKLLDKKAFVCRLTTSQFISDPLLLGQITLFLDNMKFDVIQFNNGMHGWPHTEDEYRAGFPAFLAAVRDHARGAKLIWATTTPVNDHPGHVGSLTERVKARNAIALEFVGPAGIDVDDLFTTMLPHPEYHDAGGIHFTQDGIEVQGEQVAAEIEKVLTAAK